ncbi:hypothetical protein P154DRAFT_450942 [Amniculicola lignicola CBS 123094]|uniref:Uncharacterized protein n=1 Tax=Amniculicola lignicola CBS 123094 TaxID=1392246 RepID=A0A6A5VUG8_9PLEO|nr:hypothetical protein P154DRAFT_450942 [Amniculicola lignicola CBS 123094]
MPPANSAGAPLSALSLSTLMASSLPRGAGPQLKNGYEAAALAVHAGMTAVGFRLVGLGEDDRIETHADAANPQPLPTEWNAQSSYAFTYAHSQSAMEYLVKVNRLGGKAVVFGLAIGGDKTSNFDLTVRDYISESSFPVTLSEDATPEDSARKLQDLFISSGRLADLGSLLKISVIQKLAPGLHKEGYEEERTQNGHNRQSPPPRGEPANPRRPQPQEPEPARPYPYNDPLALPPRGPGRPLPEPIPGFDDELDINRPHGGLRDDRFPGGIGHDDLYPPGLGPHDPIRPHFGGGLPRPGGMGGGMHPTFDDPMFGGQGRQGGYDPMAPPGSRYDPIGPGGAPRDGRGGFPGGGAGGFGGPGGRPPNPFGGYGSGDFM